MLLAVKVVLITSLSTICFQDVKSREVYWFLFIVVAGLTGYLHYINTLPELFFNSLIINMSVIAILLLVVYLYSNYKLQLPMRKTFALGDTFMFAALAFSFSSYSFIILLVFSLVFSLVLHLATKRFSKFNTVPLAGYMGLFFAISYISYWLGFINNVYTI